MSMLGSILEPFHGNYQSPCQMPASKGSGQLAEAEAHPAAIRVLGLYRVI